MQESELTVPQPPAVPRASIDTALNIVALVLVLAILALGGWFGYSVWAARNTAALATPALRAIEGLKAQARQAPTNIAVRIRLGEAYATAGMYEDAVKQLQEALKIDPKHTGALLDLGMLALQRKEYKTAEPYLLKVVELTEGSDYQDINGQRETALFDLGQIAMQGRRYEDAIGWYKAALRIRPASSDTYFEIAAAYKSMGDLDAALKQLDVAVIYDPSYAQAYYAVGEIYTAKKDTVNAASAYAKAAELEPDAPLPKEALEQLGTPDDWRGKALEALRKNDLDKAIDAVLVAVALDRKDISLQKLQAQIAEKKGDKKDALAILKKAQVLAPDDKDIKTAIERLSANGR